MSDGRPGIHIVDPPAGRVDPPYTDGERDALIAWLEYHRATVLWKVKGLSDDDLRRPMVPSGLSLLGVVKHLAYVERNWFWVRFLGRDRGPVPWTDADPDADFRIEPEETVEEVLEFYRTECERSREAIREASPDDEARSPGKNEGLTLRWILLHMVEETARHNGHLDILREQVDGAVGD